jgi:enoyl-CoA hydratase
VSNPFESVLKIEERGAVRILTIDRPEHLNAVSPELHEALSGVWKHLARDPEARAVVITGAGRAFSAGGDMGLLKALQSDPVGRRAQLEEAAEVVREQVAFPLPIVAAVNGPAVGLGCNVALSSDLVVMAEDTYLCDPHASIGLTAGDGGAPTWPVLMGMLRAKEYLLLGSRIPAAEAMRIGIANRVVPPDEVLKTAIELAEKLAAMPPQSVQSTKRALNLHVERAMSGILEYALAAEYHSFDMPEHQAVVDGFLAKGSS